MRHPKRAFVLLIAVAGLGIGSWYGVRTLRFERARAAAESARAGFDFQKERGRLQECLRLRPDNPPLLLLAASAARRDGDLADAERNLGRYRELTAGTTPAGLLQETLLRTVSGPLEKDVEYLIVLADTPHPSSEEIFEALAVGSNHIYQLERTHFWVEQLSKHFPRNAVGRLIRVQLDETLGKRERAEEECRGILADFPSFDRARLFLASMLGRRQKYDEAVEQFEALRGRRPDDVAVLLGLVGCLERLGRLEEARPLVRELEERHPDNSEALLHVGRIAIREQRWPDAERFLARAVLIAPHDYEIHRELAVCLYQLSRPDEARVHAERSREIEADRAKLERLLAEVVKTPRRSRAARGGGADLHQERAIERGSALAGRRPGVCPGPQADA